MLLSKTLICRYWPKKAFGFSFLSLHAKSTLTFCGVQANTYFKIVYVHDKFQAYRLQWQLS